MKKLTKTERKMIRAGDICNPVNFLCGHCEDVYAVFATPQGLYGHLLRLHGIDADIAQIGADWVPTMRRAEQGTVVMGKKGYYRK
jgi:hypothetical protein